MKVLLKRFHLNGPTTGFGQPLFPGLKIWPQIQKLKSEFTRLLHSSLDQNLNSHLLPLFICSRSSGEKVVKSQATSSRLIMSVILMTSLSYKALMFQREIWCWSLLGLKGWSQFCAEIITYHEILFYSYEENIKQISARNTNPKTFLVIFVDISIKTWKSWPNCSSRQQETVSMSKCSHK